MALSVLCPFSINQRPSFHNTNNFELISNKNLPNTFILILFVVCLSKISHSRCLMLQFYVVFFSFKLLHKNKNNLNWLFFLSFIFDRHLILLTAPVSNPTYAFHLCVRRTCSNRKMLVYALRSFFFLSVCCVGNSCFANCNSEPYSNVAVLSVLYNLCYLKKENNIIVIIHCIEFQLQR